MTQALLYSPHASVSSVTLSSPVTQSYDAPIYLSSPPSATEVNQKRREKFMARLSFQIDTNSLLDLNIKAKRAEKRRKSNEEFDVSVEEFMISNSMPKERRQGKRSARLHRIITSWREVGLDVLQEGQQMPRCTARELESAIDTFFGQPSAASKSSSKKHFAQVGR
ncbi:hypothetical protein CBS101457_002872 [Exobasidium rhododendri]|nr:hypothetical protein CBS101457_002872 [Exobasidium rhododendri]